MNLDSPATPSSPRSIGGGTSSFFSTPGGSVHDGASGGLQGIEDERRIFDEDTSARFRGIKADPKPVEVSSVQAGKPKSWRGAKRESLDQIRKRTEGLRNSEHNIHKVVANLKQRKRSLAGKMLSRKTDGGKRKPRNLRGSVRLSILQIKSNEKILQVEWKRRYWDLFVCLYILVYNFVTPYRVSFLDLDRSGSESGMFAYERITEVAFIIDIVRYYGDK